MAYELLIQNGDKVFEPAVSGDITWKTERKNYPRRTEIQSYFR